MQIKWYHKWYISLIEDSDFYLMTPWFSIEIGYGAKMVDKHILFWGFIINWNPVKDPEFLERLFWDEYVFMFRIYTYEDWLLHGKLPPI